MASIRNLKKDIDYLVFEVVSDSFTYAGLYPGKHTEELSDIVEEAVELRNDLIRRVNNPEGDGTPAAMKSNLQSVRKDLFTGVDKLFGRLSSVTKEK
jgi:hypothetical protein